MKLSDIIADADVLLSLEPEELGLLALPFLSNLARTSNGMVSCGRFVEAVIGYQANPNYQNSYPHADSKQIERALREAFESWLGLFEQFAGFR